MNIKITNCSSPELWYHNTHLVGRKFSVIDEYDNSYEVLAPKQLRRKIGLFINKLDCEVIDNNKNNHKQWRGNK